MAYFSTFEEDSTNDFPTEEELLEAFNEKPIVKLLSHATQVIKPHLTCVNPLGGIDNAADAIQELVALAAETTHDLNYNFIDYKEFEVLKPEPVRLALNEFNVVLRHDYLPVNTKEKQGQIALTFVSPLLGFLDAEMATRQKDLKVLILGAGVGKDIRRIRERANGSIKVVCVEPDEKAADELAKTYPNVTLYPWSLARSLDLVVEQGPYDIILCNMSAHYIFGVQSAHDVVQKLPSLLKRDGIMFGSYVDTQAVKASGMQQTLKTGHSVTYMGEDYTSTYYGEKPIRGIATIGVAGVMWQDPIIDTAMLYSMFEGVPININVFDGHTILFGPESGAPIYKAPEQYTQRINRPELSFYRCMLISHPAGKYCQPHSVPVSLVKTRVSGLTEQAMLYQANKGRLLQPYESQFIQPGLCWLADKKDGVMAKLVHRHKGIEIAFGNNDSFKIKGFASSVDDDFTLQIEMIKHESGNVDYEGAKYFIVVVDVIRAPWGNCGSFISRWYWLLHLYEQQRPVKVHPGGKKEVVEWPFVLQEYVDLGSPRAFEILRDAKEGVVIQSLTAPPGLMKNGAGSAHYVKRVITKDVLGVGGVEEREVFTNQFIRMRPDKKVPNSPGIIARLKTAVRYDEFVAYVFFVVVGAFSADRRRIARNLVNHTPLRHWNLNDVLWLNRNRYDPYLSKLFPDVARFMDTLFPIMCHADTCDSLVEDVEVAEEDLPMQFGDDDDVVAPVMTITEHLDDIVPVVLTDEMFRETRLWDENLEVIVKEKRKKKKK